MKGLELLSRAFVAGLTPAVTFEKLIPASACVESFDDAPAATMFPEEAAAIAHAVIERRREFATVRSCARRALSRLGIPPTAILPDADGVPQWPAGIVGSMTHCAGYRAAVVAPSDRLGGIGIDAELHAALPDSARDLVLGSEEHAAGSRRLRRSDPDVHWDTIVFCAKEAVFKARYPSTRRWLDFADISVTLHPEGTFQARAGARLTTSTGCWVVDRRTRRGSDVGDGMTVDVGTPTAVDGRTNDRGRTGARRDAGRDRRRRYGRDR